MGIIFSLVSRVDSDEHGKVFLSENLAPVTRETEATGLACSAGAIPKDIAGMYIRNGPNPPFKPRRLYHWFEGDGMLHGVRLQQGVASFINRWVRTERFLKNYSHGQKHGTQYYFSLFGDLRGTLMLVTFLACKAINAVFPSWVNPWNHPYSLSNTAVLYYCRRFFALVESSPPVTVSLPSLTTVGQERFGGKLTHPFTAHPKICSITKELVFFGYSANAPHCCLSIVTPSGEKLPSVEVPIDTPVMMHDFAITEHYAVILDLPLVFNTKKIVRGMCVVDWDGSHTSRIGLVRRSAVRDVSQRAAGDVGPFDDHDVAKGLRKAPVQWFNLKESCYIFHVSNAWEEGGGSLVQLVGMRHTHVNMAFDKYRANKDLAHNHDHGCDGKSAFLYKWTLNLETGAVEETLLSKNTGEFPVINNAFCAQPTRFTWYGVHQFAEEATRSRFFALTGIVKHDITTGEEITFRLENGEECDEFVFAPRHVAATADGTISAPSATAEDDGYMMGYVYIPAKDSSELVILCASTMRVVSRIALPQRVPHGFHGIYVTEKELADQQGMP